MRAETIKINISYRDSRTISMARRFQCGKDLPTVSDMQSSLDEALSQKFEFVAVPLVHPR